jgi:hypothetical protein
VKLRLRLGRWLLGDVWHEMQERRHFEQFVREEAQKELAVRIRERDRAAARAASLQARLDARPSWPVTPGLAGAKAGRE